MRIVCISDTHSLHEGISGGVPKGDILIHSGDFCGASRRSSVEEFLSWFSKQPHKHKICIAGNHDGPFEKDHEWAIDKVSEYKNIIYLQDSYYLIDGVKFYGSPWQPEFCDWFFNLPRGKPLKEKWDIIPDDTDVLITHGPPYGILDKCPGHAGCKELAKAVKRIKPKLHVFGHIHEGYGKLVKGKTTFVNASCLNGKYWSVNKPIIVDI